MVVYSKLGTPASAGLGKSWAAWKLLIKLFCERVWSYWVSFLGAPCCCYQRRRVGPLLWASYQRKHIRFRVQSLGITKENILLLWKGATSWETNLCLCSCCCHSSDIQETLTGYVMGPGHAGQPAGNQKTLLQKELLFPLQLRICRHLLSPQQDSDSY